MGYFSSNSVDQQLFARPATCTVYCVCRLPEDGNRRMIQCVKCTTWYDEDCELIEAKAWDDEEFPWKCRKCINRSTWVQLSCWVLMHCFIVMNINDWIGISYVIDDINILNWYSVCIDIMSWREIFSDTSYSSPARVTWAKTAAAISKWKWDNFTNPHFWP